MNKLARNLAITVLLCCLGAAQADPTVSITPNKSVVGVGDTFTVDIVMTDFPTTQGGGLSLDYREGVVTVKSVTVNGTAWNFKNKSGTINNDQGILSEVLFSAFPGVTGDATIATVEFEAIRKGRSHLRLSGSDTNPFASAGDTPSVNYTAGASIRVKPGARNKAQRKNKRKKNKR